MVSWRGGQEMQCALGIHDSGVDSILKILLRSRPLGYRARFAEKALRTGPT